MNPADSKHAEADPADAERAEADARPRADARPSIYGFVLRRVRRVVLFVVGVTVVLVGLALVFLPGPAVVVVPLGFGILGLEFAWARRLIRRARAFVGLPVTEGDDDSPGSGASSEGRGPSSDPPREGPTSG